MLDQTLDVQDYSIEGTLVTFSFRLTTTYNGATEINEDTYTVDLGTGVDASNAVYAINGCSEITELKATCANAIQGIPLPDRPEPTPLELLV